MMGSRLKIRSKAASVGATSSEVSKTDITTRKWLKPPAELIRFVRALAVDDARRDHDAALATARRPHADGPDFHLNDRSTGR